LTIFAKDEKQISDAVLKKMFHTTDIFILVSNLCYYKGLSDFVILVRSNNFNLDMGEFYGFKCRLTDFVHFDDSLTILRDSKKK
jgi:hypothetical protein